MESNFNKKVLNATKWSVITEIIAKIVSPIVQMILARIIDKEALGIVAIVTMVTSFSEIFVDAGFQKYIIQHDFKSEEEYSNYSNVAFWSNMIIATIIYLIIFGARHSVAKWIGLGDNPIVLVVACIQILMVPLTSVQMARFRRNFKFDSLFIIRFIGSLIPLMVTVPLGFLGYRYWAMIIGLLCSACYNAIALTIKSDWKPRFYFDVEILKSMFSYSMWTLLDQIVIWMTAWFDSFIIGVYLSPYQLGIYKTPVNMVTALLGVFTSALVPVLFSTLSRLQSDRKKVADVFFRFQRMLSYIILPLGLGGFIYRSTVTQIFLGKGWGESELILGITILAIAIRTVCVSLYSEVWRSIGKPRISMKLQIADLVILLVGSSISLKYGIMIFVLVRSLLRFDLIIPEMIVMKKELGVRIKDSIRNFTRPVICTSIMGGGAIVLRSIFTGIYLNVFGIIICILLYFIVFKTIGGKDFELIWSVLNQSIKKKVNKR